MNTLTINNDYSFLVAPVKIKEQLHEKLSFLARNYWATPAYQQHKWSGKIFFFDKQNGKFLTGLLPEITTALNYWNCKYEITDNRTKTEFLYPKIDNQFLQNCRPPHIDEFILEDYQVSLVNQAIQFKRGIVKAPTGGGKSAIMLAIIKSLPKTTNILFLANRKGVIHNFYKELTDWKVPNVGVVQGKTCEPNQITVATLQSLHHIPKLLPKFNAIICDEVHLLMSPKAIKAYKKLTNADIRIAVSATPFKYDLKTEKKTTEGDKVHKYNVKGYFGPLFKTDVTTESLQERGRLAKSKCIFYPITEPKNIEYDIYIDAVTNGISNNWYLHKVVSTLAKSLKGRTLILVERINHGDALQPLIPGSLWVRGADKDDVRNDIVEQLQSSKEDLVVIATAGIFSVSLNVKIHNFINCSGGKAEHDTIQRIGRGLRTNEDKDELLYIDFLFKTNPYLEKHSKKRIKILEAEGHDVEIKPALIL